MNIERYDEILKNLEFCKNLKKNGINIKKLPSCIKYVKEFKKFKKHIKSFKKWRDKRNTKQRTNNTENYNKDKELRKDFRKKNKKSKKKIKRVPIAEIKGLDQSSKKKGFFFSRDKKKKNKKKYTLLKQIHQRRPLPDKPNSRNLTKHHCSNLFPERHVRTFSITSNSQTRNNSNSVETNFYSLFTKSSGNYIPVMMMLYLMIYLIDLHLSNKMNYILNQILMLYLLYLLYLL